MDRHEDGSRTSHRNVWECLVHMSEEFNCNQYVVKYSYDEHQYVEIVSYTLLSRQTQNLELHATKHYQSLQYGGLTVQPYILTYSLHGAESFLRH